MALPATDETRQNKRGDGDSGQAVLECAFSLIVMLSIVFAMVDFSRAIYQQQEMTSLAAQAANLALRGTALSSAASTAVTQSNNLNLSSYGKVIISAAYN